MQINLCSVAVLVTILLATGVQGQTGGNSCFKAAVVDYSLYEGSHSCRTDVARNLNVYEKIAAIAKENGVQMLVFPEYGILFGSPQQMQPCLEEIPDPMLTTDYNPCLQPDKYEEKFPILTRLSCLARENGLYLVANYGTKQKGEGDSDEYVTLNTNVVFDPSGLFIRRYRKWHPFVLGEPFAKSPRLEHVYFDTQFGRMGVFTCFDMLFKQPAMDLVEQFRIDTAIFPTAWLDEVPMLTAVQIQDGWSSAHGVNLLASNLLRPGMGAIGSGIYSGNRSLYRAPGVDEPGKPRRTQILISTVPSRRADATTSQESCEAKTKIVELDDNANHQPYMRLSLILQPGDTIQSLTELEGRKTVCSGKVCCTVDYALDTAGHDDTKRQLRKLVILVRDSIRFGGWYEQVCTLATLKSAYVEPKTAFDLDQLQFDSNAAAVGFKRLTLKAEFDTKYVFPSCAHNLTKLVERDQRHMHCQQATGSDNRQVCQLDYLPAPRESSSEARRLYSFGMYGRVFERDQEGQQPAAELMGAIRLTS